MHQQHPFDSFANPISATQVEEEQKRFMWRVYRWMTLGLVITGVVSLFVASSQTMISLIFGNQIIFYGLLILELIMVWTFSSIAARSSAAVAMALFTAYAFVNGLTMAVIFLAYTASSVASVFFITAGTFGSMSAYGYLTKKDLTSVGSFCIMGLWGIILAMIVNIFIGSNALGFIISCAGVLIFVGLTAYDTQKIKEMNVIGNEGSDDDTKEALHGALILYLDFINLFLMLLRLFGRRR